MLIPGVSYSGLISVLLKKVVQVPAQLQSDGGHHPPQHPPHVWQGGCYEPDPLGVHLTSMVLVKCPDHCTQEHTLRCDRLSMEVLQ